MKNRKLINKIQFILINCGKGNNFFAGYPDVFYNLGLLYLEIYADERGYVIKYMIPYKESVKVNFIHIYNDGKRMYNPQRRSIDDFRISSKVMDYVENTLYTRAKIKYLNEVKKFVTKINNKKEYTRVCEQYGSIIDDLDIIQEYCEKFSNESEKEKDFINGEYSDDIFKVKVDYLAHNNRKNSISDRIGKEYKVTLKDEEETMAFDLNLYFSEAAELKSCVPGEWVEHLHELSDCYRAKISQIKVDDEPYKLKKEN